MIGKKINQLATELAPVSTDLTIIGDPDSGVSKKITLAQLGAIFSGAVSFYTNLAAFPTPGTTDVIYCAKDTQKLYLWSGSAYVEVFPSQALLNTYQLRSEKGVSNGYASLDSGGKVPISQLPSSIMEYKGTWNAATNTPTLANGTGDTGDVYICNVAGTVNFGAGPITFAVGDYVIYSGTIWQRSSGAVGTVTSVALSRSGDALAITGSPVTTSGTINIGFAGNSTQYINGAGNLVTFPGVINEAQNLITEVYNKTGATLTKGTVVYINGGQGNLPTITKALATGDSTSAQTYGIVRNDITNNNNGYVVVAGRISDLDTQAYTEGTQLYLSSTTAGAYTSTKQYAPNHLVYVGIVVRAHPTQGVIEVKIQNGYEMDELHNVAAQSPSNNDGLFWEASTSLWKNKSIATILGYTPQAQLNGTGFVKASGTTISYDNSTYVTTDTFQTISASKTFSLGFSIASAGGTNQISVFQNTNSLFSGSGGSNIFGFNSANNIYFGKGLDNGGVLQWNNSAVRYYTLPDATGTIALVGGSGVGTVTSIGLSSATSGVTIGSTPITTSGTITLAIATASGSQQGLLSSTDWTTFNNKQNALTNPVTGTGTTNYLPKFTGASTIGNSLVFDNGTNVGIGTASPTVKLDVRSGNVAIPNGWVSSTGWQSNGTEFTTASNIYNGIYGITGDAIGFATAASERMRLNASGNLGLGVSPSAWSGFTTLELQGGFIGGGGTTYFEVGQNNYYDGSFRYKTTGAATVYEQNAGRHIWYQAPSGTAGNAISFTQAMTLTSAGELCVGRTSAYGAGFLVNVEGNIYASAAIVAGSSVTASTINLSSELTINRSTASSTYLIDLYNSHASNNAAYTTFRNAGVTMSIGVERSVGGAIINGGAYTGVITTVGTKDLNLATNEIIRLNLNGSTGNVGIGTTTPEALLHINKSTAGGEGGYIYIDNAATSTLNSSVGLRFGTSSGASFSGVYTGDISNIVTNASNGASDLTFGTFNGSSSGERMRITSGGFVGIGTSSPSTRLHVFKGVSDGSIANFEGASGEQFVLGINSTENYIYTTANGKGLTFYVDDAERMRITSDGALLVGASSAPSSTQSGVAIQNPRLLGPTIFSSGNVSDNRTFIQFVNSNGVVGSISTSGTLTSYNVTSDYRLKQDYKDYSGLDLVNKIKTYDYEWKADKTRGYGVIAHELQSVINYAVTGVKDGKEMQGVDYSKIVPVLIKAIQEQQTQIEQLKNK
jgi:hypothetical protein